jgi:hypothetical protein
MPLTFVQQGKIGEMETAKLLMMGSGGLLEIATPLTDDERRDQEVHKRGQFGMSAALQVKTSTYLHWMANRVTALLQVQFSVAEARLVNDPLFWYLFAYLDAELMGFRDPIFLVDSTTVHTHASTKLVAGKRHIEFQGSMSPTARDVWAPFQVSTRDLGKRVLEILKTHGGLKTALPTVPNLGPGLLWVGTHRAAA